MRGTFLMKKTPHSFYCRVCLMPVDCSVPWLLKPPYVCPDCFLKESRE